MSSPVPVAGVEPRAPLYADRDGEVVAAQIGRDPRGTIAVVARCAYGLPVVVRTPPRLEDGTPFPTLYYLVCPVAVRAIGRLEASGRMRELEQLLVDDAGLREEYARAHDRYRAQRDALGVIEEPMSAGGMPARVKCLHALYAHDVADGNPLGALVRPGVEPLECPAECVAARGDGTIARATRHPGYAGKRGRGRP